VEKLTGFISADVDDVFQAIDRVNMSEASVVFEVRGMLEVRNT